MKKTGENTDKTCHITRSPANKSQAILKTFKNDLQMVHKRKNGKANQGGKVDFKKIPPIK